jgi:hypothetical protein
MDGMAYYISLLWIAGNLQLNAQVQPVLVGELPPIALLVHNNLGTRAVRMVLIWNPL